MEKLYKISKIQQDINKIHKSIKENNLKFDYKRKPAGVKWWKKFET